MKRDEYSDFAEVYDSELLGDKKTLDAYKEWRGEVTLAIKKYKLKVNTLIDLACGTGNTAIPWIKKGYKVVGVDLSKAMLRVARKKSKKVKWINQDIVKLKLNEKGEVATCHYAAINHILTKKDFQKVLNNVFLVLNPGGLFMFDLKPEEAYIWLNKKDTFYQEEEDFYNISSKYDPKSKILKTKRICFLKKGNLYKKKEFIYTEKAYSKKEIEQMLVKSGFKILKIKKQKVPEWDGKPRRWIFLVRK